MQLALVIALGGALGATARWQITQEVARRLPDTAAAWGTFAVNVSGSLVAGIVAGALLYSNFGEQPLWRGFVLTGFLGGFTTFSAYSLDSVKLIERGEIFNAALYPVSAVVPAIVAAPVGPTPHATHL
ncbi:MAG: CrcB family protein, partial [Alphaproteobacteria bacterium]|nr:CrcB family protein [Alphaproteobacteria bacterium]